MIKEFFHELQQLPGSGWLSEVDVEDAEMFEISIEMDLREILGLTVPDWPVGGKWRRARHDLKRSSILILLSLLLSILI
jgi:hypothetical protein